MIDICASFGANTGKGSCPVRMKDIKHIIPSGATFTDDQLSTSAKFKIALKATMLLIIGTTGKSVVFPKINQQTDNTGENDEQSLADGYSEVLVEKVPKYLLESVTDYCTNVAMTAFNGYLGGVYVVDADNVLWWIKTDDTNRGFSIGSLNTPVPRFGTKGAINTVKTKLSFGTPDEFKICGALKLDFDVATLTNQVTVNVVEADTQNANVFYLTLVAACSGIDVFTAYATALASALRWVATADGASLAITTVAQDTVNTSPVAGTRASGTETITVIGADGDTIDPKVNAVTLVAAPVAKTSSESTVTLLAAKIAAAITAAVGSNGGYTATNTAGAITILGPLVLGATLNTITPTATIVGTITATHAAFSGGVTPVVARTATGASWKVTTDQTAFGALATGAVIEINIDTPTNLATAGITGIEGREISYTK